MLPKIEQLARLVVTSSAATRMLWPLVIGAALLFGDVQIMIGGQ